MVGLLQLGAVRVWPDLHCAFRTLPSHTRSRELWLSFMCIASPQKLVQWAVARPDLFPEALISRLSHVHELVRVHPWAHTEHALTAALGEGVPTASAYKYNTNT